MPSTVIRRFDYDAARRRLTVVFTSGEVYAYDGVPAELAEAFRAAFSKGRFFGAHVRDAFPHRRLGRIEG